MKYLVDSDYVADYLGAHAIQLLSSFVKGEFSLSLITYGEIYEVFILAVIHKKQQTCFNASCCKFTHTVANRDPHMLQNESGIIYLTERFELRGNRSHQFRRLEKGGHTSIAS